MKLTKLFPVLLLASVATAFADKGDIFYVNPHGRFYMEAVNYLSQGTKLLNKGDRHGAKQCFDSAIRIDKNIWPAYIDRAEIFLNAGQLDLALQDCNTASHLRPDFYRTFILRGEIYRRLGRCREALTDLDRIVSFHGNPETDALALNYRALLRTTCKVDSPRSNAGAGRCKTGLPDGPEGNLPGEHGDRVRGKRRF